MAMRLRWRSCFGVRGLLWRNALVLMVVLGVFLFACIWARTAPKVPAMLIQRNLHISQTEGHMRGEEKWKGQDADKVHPFPLSRQQVSPSSSSSLASIRHDSIGQPVLDKDGIKIMPKAPVVPEGNTLQISCVAKQLIKRQEQDAPYLTFQFPPMPGKYERKISMILRPGAAVLKFHRVMRAHAGTYRCVASHKDGKQTYNSVTVNIIKKDNFSDDFSRDEKLLEKEDWLQVERLQNESEHKTRDDEGALFEKLHHLHDHDNSNVDIQDLLAKGEFQQTQVQRFCHKYNLSHMAGELPPAGNMSSVLYRHLLINDKAQTLFCFAPKTGCTNLRILFFIVLGYIPISQFLQTRDGVDQNRLEAAQFQESFFSRNDNQRLYAFNHYFKFVMYRHPLERLVSGYRSKVARYPLSGLHDDKPHFNWLRKSILLYTQPEQYSTYIQCRGKTAINISFPDFIQYWLSEPPRLKDDEHFSPISSLCQPCRTQFTFYGNFKNFDVDSQILVENIRAQPQYLRGSYYGEDTTAVLAPQLYAQLSQQQKHKVLALLAQELDFFYHIFPEEVNSHKSILSLDSNLPQIVLR